MFMDSRVSVIYSSEAHNVEHWSWNLMVCATSMQDSNERHAFWVRLFRSLGRCSRSLNRFLCLFRSNSFFLFCFLSSLFVFLLFYFVTCLETSLTLSNVSSSPDLIFPTRFRTNQLIALPTQRSTTSYAAENAKFVYFLSMFLCAHTPNTQNANTEKIECSIGLHRSYPPPYP